MNLSADENVIDMKMNGNTSERIPAANERRFDVSPMQLAIGLLMMRFGGERRISSG